MDPEIPNFVIPNFVVPFPPEITPEEVISRRSRRKLKSRPPNRFLIYRLAYLKRLKDLINIEKISMTDISPYISKSWYAERFEVREEYGRLSNQVGELLNISRRESFVLITENPGPRGPPPPAPPLAPPAAPESQPPALSRSEQEIHYLFNLYFGM